MTCIMGWASNRYATTTRSRSTTAQWNKYWYLYLFKHRKHSWRTGSEWEAGDLRTEKQRFQGRQWVRKALSLTLPFQSFSLSLSCFHLVLYLSTGRQMMLLGWKLFDCRIVDTHGWRYYVCSYVMELCQSVNDFLVDQRWSVDSRDWLLRGKSIVLRIPLPEVNHDLERVASTGRVGSEWQLISFRSCESGKKLGEGHE